MLQEILQIIGYSASIIIAISMTVSSILKFRIINLIGALTFAIYGFLIGAIPVGILNTFIAGVDIYFILKIFNKEDYFQVLVIRPDNKYLLAFLDFYKKDIQTFFPGFKYKPEINTVSFFILRDMQVAGIFLAHKEGDGTLKIGLDFVTPEYRDFKSGKHVFIKLRNYFLLKGYKEIKTYSNNKIHTKYLKRMGFQNTEGNTFIKTL
jgi:hypothetical protein